MMKPIDQKIYLATLENLPLNWESIQQRMKESVSRRWITESLSRLARQGFLAQTTVKRVCFYQKTALFTAAYNKEVLGIEEVSAIQIAMRQKWSVSGNDIYKRLGG